MAKLSPDQLGPALRKKLAQVYVVLGDEPLLVQESSDHIRKAAREQGYSELERHHVETGFDWNHLLISANSLSLFSDKKVIELRIRNGKPGDQGNAALIEYCQRPPEDTILLIVFPKLDTRTQNTKWFKSVAAVADVVTIWPVNTQQLPRWINQRLRAAGVNANSEAIDILCTKVEGNLLAAVQEIEKLKLLVDKDLIDGPSMAEAVTDSARYSIFDLIDKAYNGDARAASTCLLGLRAEGNVPLVLLSVLANNIRSLCRIKEAMTGGISFDSAAKTERVWKNKMLLTKRAVDRLKVNQMYRLLRMAADADKTIKGAKSGDIWSELQSMILLLSSGIVLAL
ncbi:MAG: DNA polymerase-3 subunit delta [Flavobacteriales bacterium]|jgi:DNA polymerase-3 subunit delta